MTNIKAILHASYIVSDLEKSVTFYRDVLGLKSDVSRPELGFAGAWFDIGDSGQQIHLLALPNPDPVTGRPQHGGRDRHVAFAVSDLAAIEQALSASSTPFTRSKSGRAALFCRDPDGNAIELIQSLD